MKEEIENITNSNKILVSYYDNKGKIKVLAKGLTTEEAFELLTATQEQLFDIIKK